MTQELESSALRPDGSREHIVVADVRGRFHRARTIVFAALFVIGGALPWITVGGNPAVLIDFPGKRSCVFGAVFGPQDAWLGLAILLTAALALLATTVVLGRAFCGWACPQTVLLDGVFRRVERWVWGTRADHLRREARGSWLSKLPRRLAEHALDFVVAAALAHGLAAYFTGPRELLKMIANGPAASPQAFAWAAGLSVLLYLDVSWFREQLCLIVCPYGRLQSVLLDVDSLVVAYDARRGEPRGKVSASGAGDCVDCRRCVAVCPTGIDIRGGLQLDCVACTACIDACDGVMDKLGRARGLVRYDSQRRLMGERALMRWVRPRSVVFVGLSVLSLALIALGLGRRRTFDANLLRLPGPPFTVDRGVLRNGLEVHIVNKRTTPETYVVEPHEDPDLTFVMPLREVVVLPGRDVFVPFFVTAPADRLQREVSVALAVRSRRGGEPTKVLRAAFVSPDS